MASSLGMETVGEGVEEPGQLDMLRSLNCRYAQGYLISKPMLSERLDDVYAIGDERGDDPDEEIDQLVPSTSAPASTPA
jgi:EAL domain-containing protein (putative c-di-GMP-specific phosphodiesterase class I)